MVILKQNHCLQQHRHKPQYHTVTKLSTSRLHQHSPGYHTSTSVLIHVIITIAPTQSWLPHFHKCINATIATTLTQSWLPHIKCINTITTTMSTQSWLPHINKCINAHTIITTHQPQIQSLSPHQHSPGYQADMRAKWRKVIKQIKVTSCPPLLNPKQCDI